MVDEPKQRQRHEESEAIRKEIRRRREELAQTTESFEERFTRLQGEVDRWKLKYIHCPLTRFLTGRLSWMRQAGAEAAVRPLPRSRFRGTDMSSNAS